MRILKKIKWKLPLHPSFILLFVWFAISGNFGAFCIFVSVVLTHELGHYFVARRLGYKLNSFFLAPYGVSLNYKEKVFESRDEIKIAVAGPAVNLILAILTVMLWWLFPVIYSYTSVFVSQSVMLALFNLIPAYPLDGGRIFVGALSESLSRKKAIKIIIASNIVFSLIFIILFVVSCFINFNPTFALAGCFMIVGAVQTKYESKYQAMNLFNKKVKNFSKPSIMVIGDDVTISDMLKHLQVNKWTIFYVTGQKSFMLDDKIVLAWSLRYPATSTISDIINKK